MEMSAFISGPDQGYVKEEWQQDNVDQPVSDEYPHYSVPAMPRKQVVTQQLPWWQFIPLCIGLLVFIAIAAVDTFMMYQPIQPVEQSDE
ncbi:MAG: hypothetical protein AAF327_18065 [Cyanobacteria bacterium P01_A01_bin.37]